MNSSQHILKSIEQTEKLAKQLAISLDTPQVLALYGDLGAGKTTFVRAFVKSLSGGDKIRVKSPSYALHHAYKTQPEAHHLDLFRMAYIDQVEELGLLEVILGEHGFVLIEWPELVDSYLPKNTIKLQFELTQNDEHKLEIQNLPPHFKLRVRS